MRRSAVEFCRMALGASLSACGADGFGSGGPAYPGESAGDVGTARNAVAEATCWTDAAPDTTVSIGASGRFAAPSSDGAYDHASCRHRWIVEATDVANKPVVVSAGSLAIPSAGEEWCAGYWSESRALGCRTSPCEWTELGAWSERARWRTGSSPEVGVCERLVSGTPPELASTHGFSTIRVVTQSGWVYWYRAASVSFTVLPL